MSESKDERWWEFYFIRYFVGTVFGMALIAFLNFDQTSPLHGKLLLNLVSAKELNFAHSVVLGAIGLAFCYIASAPILVFHALRGNFTNIFKGEISIIGVGCWCLLVFIVLAAISWLCFGAIFPQGKNGSLAYISIALFDFIYGVQVFLYLYSWSSKGNVLNYYKRLSHERSKRSGNNNVEGLYKEYVESYKHLREHGNAFFILIMEMALATMLYAIESPIYSAVLVAVWVMPAFLVWFVGTYLEMSLCDIEK